MLRYLLIGGTAALLDLVVFLVAHNVLGLSAWQAQCVSVPVAVVFSFVLNARHNFATSDYPVMRFALFVGVCAIGFVVGYKVIDAFEDVGLSTALGKVVSLPVVFLVQYGLNSQVVFRPLPSGRVAIERT